MNRYWLALLAILPGLFGAPRATQATLLYRVSDLGHAELVHSGGVYRLFPHSVSMEGNSRYSVPLCTQNATK
jgi:hypothetical protein